MINNRLRFKKSNQQLHYARGITPKRVTSGISIFVATQLRGNVAAVATGEPLAALCSILPALESNSGPSAPISMSLTTTATNCFAVLKLLFFRHLRHTELCYYKRHAN